MSLGSDATQSVIADLMRSAWRIAAAVIAVLTLALAWLVATGNLYKAGSDLGYYLGLVGGSLMLSLLLYPLRKRVRVLDRLGGMAGWFKYHMFAGILGPTLILFHTTFRVDAMNSRVALYSMLLVVFSGVVGRFLYRHLHRGLYGQEVTLADVEAELAASVERIGSVYALQADIETRLQAFRDEALAPHPGFFSAAWSFIRLRGRGRRLSKEIRHDAKRALSRLAKEKKLAREEVLISYQLAKEQINRYISAIVSVSQHKKWERLFSLWHIVHIPFLYLLLISGIVHVIAVHMY